MKEFENISINKETSINSMSNNDFLIDNEIFKNSEMINSEDTIMGEVSNKIDEFNGIITEIEQNYNNYGIDLETNEKILETLTKKRNQCKTVANEISTLIRSKN